MKYLESDVISNHIILFQVWPFPKGNKAQKNQWSLFSIFLKYNCIQEWLIVCKSGYGSFSLSLQWIPGAPSCGYSDLHCYRPSLTQRPHNCSYSVLWCGGVPFPWGPGAVWPSHLTPCGCKLSHLTCLVFRHSLARTFSLYMHTHPIICLPFCHSLLPPHHTPPSHSHPITLPPLHTSTLSPSHLHM